MDSEDKALTAMGITVCIILLIVGILHGSPFVGFVCFVMFFGAAAAGAILLIGYFWLWVFKEKEERK